MVNDAVFMRCNFISLELQNTAQHVNNLGYVYTCQLQLQPTKTCELQPIRNQNGRFCLVAAAHRSWLGCG